jgi:hypothetical protein
LVIIAAICASAFSSNAFALRFPTSHAVTGIAVGDMNGDGLDDIVTCGNADGHGSLNVLLGNGDGTFQKALATRLGPAQGSLVLGDFNFDGHLDVATASSQMGSVRLLLGNGDGTFAVSFVTTLHGVDNAIAAADLNHDGFLDLVVGQDTQFISLLGDGSGGFGQITYTTVSSPNNGIALGDIDGDGNIDVFTGGHICMGKGDGTFVVAPPVFGLIKPYLFDLDNDGQLDLAGILFDSTDNFELFLRRHSSYNEIFDIFNTGLSFHDFAPADINHDGKMDFVLTHDAGDGIHNYLSTVLSTGPLTFQADNTSFVVGDVIATGHFNADAEVDIVTGGAPNFAVYTAYGLGNGQFTNQ